MKVRTWAVAALSLSVVLAMSACGGSSESANADKDALNKKVAELEQKLDAATSTTAAPTTTATSTTVAPVATMPPTTAAPAAAPAAVMPNVVCMNLQDAQDKIQTAGVFYSRSFDATGAGRMQVIDSNWIVVSQDPAPGAPIGEGTANLGAVKYGEPNPC